MTPCPQVCTAGRTELSYIEMRALAVKLFSGDRVRGNPILELSLRSLLDIQVEMLVRQL